MKKSSLKFSRATKIPYPLKIVKHKKCMPLKKEEFQQLLQETYNAKDQNVFLKDKYTIIESEYEAEQIEESQSVRELEKAQLDLVVANKSLEEQRFIMQSHSLDKVLSLQKLGSSFNFLLETRVIALEAKRNELERLLRTLRADTQWYALTVPIRPVALFVTVSKDSMRRTGTKLEKQQTPALTTLAPALSTLTPALPTDSLPQSSGSTNSSDQFHSFHLSDFLSELEDEEDLEAKRLCDMLRPTLISVIPTNSPVHSSSSSNSDSVYQLFS